MREKAQHRGSSSGASNSEGAVLASELEEKTREEIDIYKMGMIELRGLLYSIQAPTNMSIKKGEGHALLKTN